ncbi:MAG: type II toxin-antitoxin system VapC family toxin [Terriglobales bacterium]
MPLLVDTSVWVDFFNARASPEESRLRGALEQGEEIVVPGLVLAEILCGLPSRGEAERIARLFQAFSPAAELETGDYPAAAQLYRSCRRRGWTVRGLADCLVVQLCVRCGYRLLARDRDFQALAAVCPLRRELPDG